jgi:hypothetical protein
LFAIDDDRGTLVPGGIGFAQSGRDLRLSGMRLRATVGTYPALEISAVPYPLAVIVGLVVLVGGLIFAAFGPIRRIPALAARAVDDGGNGSDIGPKGPVKISAQPDRTGSPLS